MKPPLILIAGKPVALGARVGKGGEGEVYSLSAHPKKAVKLYFEPDTQRRDKIAAIIKEQLADKTKLVSFPIEFVTDGKGDFVGFTMTLVGQSKPLHELYTAKARKQNFPNADYRFLVRTAKNLANAVAAVHATGCVIGDINHSGFLISDKALVALIDADSFQIKTGSKSYLCRVGVPEYTPPELQGQTLDGIERTSNHDAFGLAVSIFQLLFMRHPFAGRFSGSDEMPMERAIAENRYTYSTARQTGMSPPPGVPTAKILPKGLAGAFELAFWSDRSKDRPTASQWVSLLGHLESTLVRCQAAKEHYFPRDAGSCPWCSMDNKFGTTLFLPDYLSSSGSAPLGVPFDIRSIWAAIEAVKLPSPNNIKPHLPAYSAFDASAGRKAKEDFRLRKAFGIFLVIAAGLLLVGMPSVWFVAIGLGLWGFNRAAGESEAFRDIRSEAEVARKNLIGELDIFHRNIGSLEPAKIRAELDQAKTDLAELPKLHSSWMREYQENRRKRQLDDFLDKFRIDKDKIQSINRGLAQTLVAYGYETAADIDHYVIQVPGIGEVRKNRLADWRKRHEAKFVLNPNPTPLDHTEKQKVDAQIANLRRELENKLRSGAGSLRDALQRIEHVMRTPHANLINTHKQFLEAAANCDAIGQPVSMPDLSPLNTSQQTVRTSRPVPSSRKSPISNPVPTRRSPRKQHASSIACPKCGSNMVKRVARRGRYRGKSFWGCPRYPACDGIKNIP